MTPDALLDLFVLSPVGMVALDDEGRVEVANAAAKRLLHPFLRAGSLDPFFDVLAPWVGDLGSMARSFADVRGVVTEGRELVVSGGAAGGHAVLLSLVKRSPGRFVALVTDASAIIEHTDRTRELEQRLKALEQGIRDYALYQVDARGVIVGWTEAAERVHHFRSDEMVGQPMARLSPPSAGGDPHVVDLLDAAVQNGWAEEEGERLRRDGTPFWATTVIATLHGAADGRAAFQVITRDLSERRRLEIAAREGTVASTDELTGVATRRGFFEVAGGEIARARRYSQSLTVLLIDPDRFRDLNDAHGTAFGDECLRTIAWVCRQESRTTDVVGRVGSAEFAVLLPSTELSGGLVLAERIRERMQRHVFPAANSGVRCLVSIGVVELREDAASVDGLLGLAETAVRRAKQAGRNLVVGLDE